MSGAKAARGRYTSAGYKKSQDTAGLYIQDVPAGSPQEEMRDLNRVGYRASRPWNEASMPLFEGETAAAGGETVCAPRKRRKQGFFAYLTKEAAKSKKDVTICLLLCAAILVIVAAWGQKMVQGVEIQRDIASYQSRTIELEKQNERLSQQLEMASSGERIRNLAQNELGMLRPERAQSETIYIQTPAGNKNGTLQESAEPRFETLDFLLGLLEMFNIGE